MATIIKDDVKADSQSVSFSIEGDVSYSQVRIVEYNGKVSSARVKSDFSSTLWATYLGADAVADTNVNLKTVNARCTGANGRIWEVTQTYEKLQNEASSPIDYDKKYFYRGEPTEVAVDADKDGNPIVNSAYDLFDPPILITVPRLIASVQWNSASDQTSWLSHIGKTNSDSWLGYDADCWMILNIQSDPQFSDDLTYYAITFEAMLKPDGWQPVKIINQGFREIKDGKRKNIKIKGEDASSPVPLNTNGTAILDDTDPNFLEFSPYNQVAFSAFGV